jgi:hypothetical protein
MAGFIDPSFTFNLEQRLQIIQERPYQALRDTGNLWWPYAAKVVPATGKKLISNWILQTAYIENLGQSTDLPTRELAIVDTTFTPENAGERIELDLNSFEDLDGGGIDALTEWTEQVSADSAHYPQRQIAALLNSGTAASTAAMCYDSSVFFAVDHPLNPKTGKARGTFANIFTSSAKSTPTTDANDDAYPGALPIDESVSFETAWLNLRKAFAYIASIRQANNIQPRFLTPWAIVAHPTLVPRLNTLLQAKFASMSNSAATGGGSTDIQGQLAELGYQKVFKAPELTADNSYYIIASQVQSSQLGALVWVERKPFAIQTFWPTDGKNADLARRNKMEAHCRARNVAGYGKPELIFKGCAS